MIDVLARVTRTYVQSLLGLLAASNLFDLDLASLRVLAIAALPAAIAAAQNSLEAAGVRLGRRG